MLEEVPYFSLSIPVLTWFLHPPLFSTPWLYIPMLNASLPFIWTIKDPSLEAVLVAEICLAGYKNTV